MQSKCRVIQLQQLFDQMAHKELCQEPAFIRGCYFEVLLSYGFVVVVVNKEFDRIKPTAKKLLSVIDCEESDSESFKFFKRHIRETESDLKMLRTLLGFITASDLVLYNSEGNCHRITFRMVELTGIDRRVVAHTCGRTFGNVEVI